MGKKLIDEFHWHGNPVRNTEGMSDQERYDELISWARKARRKNPNVFDKLTEWLLDDMEWSGDQLAQNRQILMQGILARFKEQNTQLRTSLLELRPTGLVNEAVFEALDRFDEELSGISIEPDLKEVVALVFSDFSVMQDRKIREKVAGDKSGPAGIDTFSFYGYVNCLKDCDAQVQWSLFMPDTVQRQQNGFNVDSFEYHKAPAMRFIGKEGANLEDARNRRKLFIALNELNK